MRIRDGDEEEEGDDEDEDKDEDEDGEEEKDDEPAVSEGERARQLNDENFKTAAAGLKEMEPTWECRLR